MATEATKHSLNAGRRGPLAPLDILNLAYIALVIILVLVGFRRVSHWGICLGAYAAVGGGLLTFLVVTARMGHPIVIFVRSWYTPLLFIFHYEFAVQLNQLFAPFLAPWIARLAPDVSVVAERLGDRVYFDSLMMKLDQWLFGFQPSVRFAEAFGAAWFGEIMHFAYASFYLFVPVLGFPLWFQHRRREFDDFLFRATFTMLACCVIFIPFPIAGPRHYLDPAGLHLNAGYLFAWIVGMLFEHLDVPNGGFPSSHVAVAASVLISACVYEKRVFALLGPLFIGLCLATVYVAGHYAVDTVAGLFAGVLFYVLAGRVRNLLERTLARWQNGTLRKAPGNGEAIGA